MRDTLNTDLGMIIINQNITMQLIVENTVLDMLIIGLKIQLNVSQSKQMPGARFSPTKERCKNQLFYASPNFLVSLDLCRKPWSD